MVGGLGEIVSHAWVSQVQVFPVVRRRMLTGHQDLCLETVYRILLVKQSHSSLIGQVEKAPVDGNTATYWVGRAYGMGWEEHME